VWVWNRNTLDETDITYMIINRICTKAWHTIYEKQKKYPVLPVVPIVKLYIIIIPIYFEIPGILYKKGRD